MRFKSNFDFKSDFERIEDDLTELFWKATVLYVLSGEDERYSFREGVIYYVAPDGKPFPIFEKDMLREYVREFFDTMFEVQTETGMVFDGIVEVVKSFLEGETKKLKEYAKLGLL